MSRNITVAAIQTSYGLDTKENLDKTIDFVRDAAKKGAQVILPSELFENIYFCTTQDPRWFANAAAVDKHPVVLGMQKIAKELGVVIPVSFFEKDGPHYYNSVAMVDHNGNVMGLYRKTHIPDGPGYSEKYYFRPGDLGFKVWDTKFGRVGVGICWDQWYPEVARAMVLQGAEVLFYPTAIGSEPATGIDTAEEWQTAMRGHSVSNHVPVVAANRIGTEKNPANNNSEQSFYGHSFITDSGGKIATQFGAKEEGVLVQTFDLDEIAKWRAMWGFFRDRRTDIYSPLVKPAV